MQHDKQTRLDILEYVKCILTREQTRPKELDTIDENGKY